MTYTSHDDCPEEFRLTRRKLMVGGVLFAGGVLLPPEVLAQSLDVSTPDFSPKFMEVSSLLIDHRLDPEVGGRMAAAMLRINSEIAQDIGAIIDIAKKKNAKIVEDFFADIPDGRLKNSALAIISAWYTGVVENSANAEVFAFETALMYQPTHDVMTIPTYAISGPNGWNAEAPPLGDMPTF
ncbi:MULTISPECIES: sorbitol dehydrogenase family protein [Rhizobium]|uniref:Sorbitol dehydrogenase family protein n=1 Tax=Rhizobium rhododendri TaxID=2506430 RepID=A0ABY8INB5_9HYPH|nr:MULTISPECIES: sorbitol dehydrogenase family protein [Rhizobium]MBZ5762350.1 sorbitol dehydrogenase family protein [Rhizobium sp. VS19-DR96]MBZ5769001.1 sorbitol dehydrogenase family protein [Rhizobium sp. VS19-DR129.2]MBZ5775930.1 sorbitol dehydrogenase family protein [Rhizobium sp. VS19-DRK62.2]MBZ5786306.1 sorbitol dehydrogenase family protein [Rhizobium sp. VS19-DR121]MBZ5804300.1 sorbitol dehydrogenase family protein [Rhizobium sp. VS19-DR181]